MADEKKTSGSTIGFTASSKDIDKSAKKHARNEKEYERTQKAIARNARHAENTRILDAGRLFIILMLVMCLFSIFFQDERDISVIGILEYLQKIKVFDFKSIMGFFRDLRIYADWGVFNVFREFINAIAGALAYFVFLVETVGNAIIYLFTILYWVLYGYQIPW